VHFLRTLQVTLKTPELATFPDMAEGPSEHPQNQLGKRCLKAVIFHLLYT